jgi:hypothetical protein
VQRRSAAGNWVVGPPSSGRFKTRRNLWLLWHVHHPPSTVVRSGVIIPALPESVGHLAVAAHGDGGEMLFKIGVVLLLAWLLGVIGVYSVGDRIHVLLLSGLLLFLLALAKARDAAAARHDDSDQEK